MERFWLNRQEDISGVSGTGIIAEGVVFSSGEAVLHWMTKMSSIAIYGSLADIEKIHGHDGRTIIVREGDTHEGLV
jgi:hypothetical protein